MTNATPSWLQQARDQWTYRGDKRPDFAIEPGPGQESAWDYPRPPAVVADQRSVVVAGPDGEVAVATHSIRVCETSHPPSFYLPPEAIVDGALVVVGDTSFCEWKGPAEYLALAGTDEAVGWRYPKPFPEFEAWVNWVSFYPDRVACTVDGEQVRPQAGGFYGGWITNDVVGPFKSDPNAPGW